LAAGCSGSPPARAKQVLATRGWTKGAGGGRGESHTCANKGGESHTYVDRGAGFARFCLCSCFVMAPSLARFSHLLHVAPTGMIELPITTRITSLPVPDIARTPPIPTLGNRRLVTRLLHRNGIAPEVVERVSQNVAANVGEHVYGNERCRGCGGGGTGQQFKLAC